VPSSESDWADVEDLLVSDDDDSAIWRPIAAPPPNQTKEDS
jgi:hypothetical protein